MIKTIDARVQRAMGQVRKAFRAVISRVNAAPAVALVQAEGLAGEPIRDAELFQHYGLTSVPPPGTMAVVLPIGGKTAHGIVIGTEHGAYRIKGLKDGEVAIYTDEGDSIVLKRGRLIEVTTNTLKITAATKVQIDTPLITTTAQVQADGEITDLFATGGQSMSAMRDLYDIHTHHENDTNGETNTPTQQT
ncbi:phage baseplate assembly protein V [Denitromonas halophila]|uniref:Phage baseplate assembly protein V n=1 Tax=Denitromonas halophila TaxID=1629404 RepID=A0A557QXA7_9RHOO|nr:phage baseplate assembly protein V [Denitromonas halophila]TVO57519.1 phage baseplate assembly protein V [Denitromonas halophila]